MEIDLANKLPGEPGKIKAMVPKTHLLAQKAESLRWV